MTQSNSLTPSQESSLAPELSGVDLRTVLRVLRRWIWLLLLGGLLGAGIGYWISMQIDPIYRAEALIVIEQTRSLSTINAPELLSNDRTNTYLEFINQGLMDEVVAAQLGISLAELQAGIANVRVNQVGRTELFEIVVEGYFPDYVSAVANALPEALNQSIVDVRMNRFEESKANLSAQLSVLQSQIDATEATIDRVGTPRTSQEENELRSQEEILAQYRASYADLVQSYENVRLVEIQSLDNIAIARSANTPTDPISSNIIINTILGFVIGFSLALTFITLVEYLDDSVKDPEAIKEATGTTLLGMIGPIPRRKTKNDELDGSLITFHEPRHPLSEHYRIIRTNLRFASVDATFNQMMVTSATSNEGKSTTATNLAISLAQAGHKVLLIDADLRKPSQHTFFKVNRNDGLVDYLFNQDDDLWPYVKETAQSNLHLMTSGHAVPNPTDLLESNRFKQALSSLQSEFNMLVFDAPPILPVSDAPVMASVIPNVILVANAKLTRQTALVQAAEALRKVGVRPVGAVLNQYSRSARGYYGYEEYYAETA